MSDTPTSEAPKEDKTIKINLKYALQTNGEVQGPGIVEVEEGVAEDLLRREAEYDKLETERLQSKEIMVDISKVTGQVLSGAGFAIPE